MNSEEAAEAAWSDRIPAALDQLPPASLGVVGVSAVREVVSHCSADSGTALRIDELLLR